jgi:hypothetical protein
MSRIDVAGDVSYPNGLLSDAIAHAERRAWREFTTVHVYARSGIVFVRAEHEPRPDNSEIITTVKAVRT